MVIELYIKDIEVFVYLLNLGFREFWLILFIFFCLEVEEGFS